ncbi:hypothetical protein IMZ08_00675 [Bacillus luteolus]|uniref:Uncharacterized protein n=1 Tax=Litchfieldia luteola TaxID=682179 RepID=A0ABR9QDJ8_9BACI|nr:hypothetical protein [Cytobacillus luteolus]
MLFRQVDRRIEETSRNPEVIQTGRPANRGNESESWCYSDRLLGEKLKRVGIPRLFRQVERQIEETSRNRSVIQTGRTDHHNTVAPINT